MPVGMLRPLVSLRFQVLFHSPPGVLFTFPSRYYALSVAIVYLALEGGPPSFRQGSSCPAVLKSHPHAAAGISPTGLSPPLVALPSGVRLYLRFLYCAGRSAPAPEWSFNPADATLHRLHTCGLGSSRFARRYSGNLPVRSSARRPAVRTAFDFYSCGYLDGSVPRVCLPAAMCSPQNHVPQMHVRLPHSDTPGS